MCGTSEATAHFIVLAMLTRARLPWRAVGRAFGIQAPFRAPVWRPFTSQTTAQGRREEREEEDETDGEQEERTRNHFVSIKPDRFPPGWRPFPSLQRAQTDLFDRLRDGSNVDSP